MCIKRIASALTIAVFLCTTGGCASKKKPAIEEGLTRQEALEREAAKVRAENELASGKSESKGSR